MFLVAWIDPFGNGQWIWVNGEQERDVAIDNLVRNDIPVEDIHVFNADDEIE